MNDYIKLAYRRAILIQLLEDLKEHYPNDVASKEVVCEDVPYRDRKVPMASLDEVGKELKGLIDVAGKELASYTMQKREQDGEPGNKSAAPRARRKVTRRKSTKA